MALNVFFGLIVIQIVTMIIMVIGCYIANKNPDSKFNKWWYK